MDNFLNNRPGFSSSRKTNTSQGAPTTLDSIVESLSASTENWSGTPGPSKPSRSGLTTIKDQSSMPGPSQPSGQPTGSSGFTAVNDQQDTREELTVERQKMEKSSAFYDAA